MKDEWRVNLNGGIFIEHLIFPRFVVQLKFMKGQTEPGIEFESNWIDPKPEDSEVEWYFEAMAFYNMSQNPN